MSTSSSVLGPSAGWLNMVKPATPKELTVNHPEKFPPILRSEKQLQAQDNGYATDGNNQIIFNFPNVLPIDLQQGYLSMNIVVRTTGGTYKRLAQGAWSCIRKIKIQCQTFEDEIQYYGRIYSWLWQTGVDNDVASTIGYDLLGLGLAADRNTWGASATGTKYVVPIYHGFLRQGILPAPGLMQGNQSLKLEITLDTASLFVETDGTNPQIDVNNLRLVYDELSSPDGYFEAEMMRIVKSGQYKIGYRSMNCYQNSVTGSSPDLLIMWKANALNGIFTVFVDGSTLADTTVSDKYITWLKTFSNAEQVTAYQININQKWLPEEKVDCTGDAYRAYIMALKWNGNWQLDGRMKFPAPIDLTSFNGTQFYCTNDFRAAPNSVLNNNEAFNSLSTAQNTGNTILHVDFTGPVPNLTIAYHFTSYNTLVCASPDGVLSKYQ